jgi:putative transposase
MCIAYREAMPLNALSIDSTEVQAYFGWYNERHHHTGLALLTPAQVHYGDPVALLSARHQTLLAAYERCPSRFGYRVPRLEVLPMKVYINPPAKPSLEAAA